MTIREYDILIGLVSNKLNAYKNELLFGKFYSYRLGRDLKDEEMSQKKINSKLKIENQIVKYERLKNKLIKTREVN